MREISLLANAKLNLYLDITGRREDGYHLLETVMQSVDLCDIVTIRPGGSEIRVSCSDPLIPEDEGNICFRAAKAYFDEIKESGGADIRIEKRIPHGAGLGGGSADAAAVLNGLNCLYGSSVRGERLAELGAEVGADVPFCMAGGTKLCRGIGEELHDTEPLPERVYLIVMPDFECDTKGAYRRYDEASAEKMAKKGGIEDFLRSGGKFPEKMYNVFRELYRDERIEAIAGKLIGQGARGASLTGSGAAVFGVFEDTEAAMNAAKAFFGYFTAVCKPVSRGIIEVDSGQ